MKNTSKIISMALANSMIIMTLILSPIPFGEINQAQAQDREKKEDCRTNEQRETGVYKAGCKFNENLNKEDIDSAYSDGIKGMIEQMIGSMFAMISISLIAKEQRGVSIPDNPVDGFVPISPRQATIPLNCSAHVAPKITPPMVAAGSLAHLVGEVRANLAFQDMADKTVNKNFGQARLDESHDRTIKDKEEREAAKAEAEKREEENDKQVASYKALRDVYSGQAEILEDKLKLVKFNEAMLIGAEAVEIGDAVANSVAGTTGYTAAVAANTTATTTLVTANTALRAGAGAYCSPVTTPIFEHITSDAAMVKANLGFSSTEASEAKADTAWKVAKLIFNLNPISLITNMFESLATNVGQHEIEKVKTATFELSNHNRKTFVHLKRQALMSTVFGTLPAVKEGAEIGQMPTPAGAAGLCYKTITTAIIPSLERIAAEATAQAKAILALSIANRPAAQAVGTALYGRLSAELGSWATQTSNPEPTLGATAVLKAIAKATPSAAATPEVSLAIIASASTIWAKEWLKTAHTELPALTSALWAYNINRWTPVQCTGAGYGYVIGKAPQISYPRLDGPLNPVSTLALQVDKLIKNPDVPFGIFGLNKQEDYYFKNVAQNTLRKIAFIKAETNPDKSANQKLKNFVSSVKYSNYVTEELMKRVRSGYYDKEIQKELNYFKENNESLQGSMQRMMAGLSEALISSAKAEKWMELLKFAGKMYVAFKFLSITFNNFGYSRPTLRMTTYAIMAGLNRMVLNHLEKAEKDASDRAKVVEEEMYAFINSRGIPTKIVDDPNQTGGKRNIKGREVSLSGDRFAGKVACASADGSPALCPSKIDPANFDATTGRERFIPRGGVLSNVGRLGSAGAAQFASGAPSQNPSLGAGNIGSVNNQNSNLIKVRDKNRKKLDKFLSKLDKSVPKNKKGKKNPLIPRVSRSAATVKKSFGNGSQSQGLFNSISSGKLPDLEKLKKEQKAAGLDYKPIKAPKFNLPKAGSNPYDFDVDDVGDAVVVEEEAAPAAEEGDLADFEVPEQEINEREDVNIFKLLSNRYLNKYPTLLEEK